MKFSVLGSSSSGNCIYIESGGTRILVDAGFSHKRTKERLAQIGVDIGSIDGLCLTHEHADHTAGLPVMYCKHHIPLFATGGTSTAVEVNTKKNFGWNLFEPGMSFEIGTMHFETFSVSHDASDPVGYVVSDGISRLGIATDMGATPDMVARHLRGCNALILEFNHDKTLLENCDRPWELKARIAGNKGHLSNEQAYDLLRNIADDALRTVFLAHISAECNTPQMAIRYAEEALSCCGLCGNARICVPTWPFPLMDV